MLRREPDFQMRLKPEPYPNPIRENPSPPEPDLLKPAVSLLLLVLLLRQISDDYYKSTNISSLQFVNRHTLHMNARRNQCSLVCDKETFRSFMIALLTTLSSLTL